MAKKNTEKLEQVAEETDNGDVQDFIKSILKDVENAHLGSEIEVVDWVPTGIRSLNYLISGDTEKGIPAGKMIVVAGESMSGKSILGGRIATQAQKKDYVVLWLDTENASDKRFFGRVGLDPEKTLYLRIKSAEQLQSHVLRFLAKAKAKNKKMFIVLDSLGNLLGTKESKDAEEDKLVADMGNRAKSLRSALAQIIDPLAETNSILFCVNHMYITPSFIPTAKMRGGEAPYLLAQIILYLTRKKGEEGVFSRIKVKTHKNREFIEGQIAEFVINFTEGIDENDGMLDLFKEQDLVKERGGWIEYEGKSYRESDLLTNPEILKTLLEAFREKTKHKGYHTFSEPVTQNTSITE